VHEHELAYLARVAEIFGFDEVVFARIRARHVVEDGADPYLVLAADPSWDFARLRRHYRQLVSESHPDRLIARGVPQEFLRIANDRLAAINVAWERIERMRAPA
jgi:DnaJ like chaperone protein